MCLFFYKLKTPDCIGCKKGKIEKFGFCSECLSRIIFISENIENSIFSVVRYEGPIKEAIQRYKYNREKYIGKYFAELLKFKIIENRIDFDLIIPVPLHWKKEFLRTFNQSALVGNYLSKILNKKMSQRVLIKSKNTVSQTELSEKERKENVKESFKVKNSRLIKDKKILLIDDVYTTGATTKECKKELLKNGAKKVIILTIAKS